WPALAQVVIAPPGRIAFIAGQAAVDREFRVVGTTLREQTEFAIVNLCTALKAVGAGPDDIVSSTVYIAGLDEAKSADFFAALQDSVDGQPFPPHAITVVGVTSLASP